MNEENENGYPEVRELTRKDRKKLSELIKAFAERSGNIKLTEMLPGRKGDAEKSEDAGKDTESGNDQVYELIKSVMDGLIAWTEEELAEWFMDLVGVTDRDAWDDMPFDIEVYIIDQLLAQKGFNNFFTRAWGLYKKIPGLTD